MEIARGQFKKSRPFFDSEEFGTIRCFAGLDHPNTDHLASNFIAIMTVEFRIEDSQAGVGNKPCGSSTNLAAMPLSNWA
jgi:hypothetical protein